MTERLSEEALREDIRKALRSTLSFEESVNNVLSLILQERQAWGEQLVKELREYREKYPDADYNDLSGYVVGYTHRANIARDVGASR